MHVFLLVVSLIKKKIWVYSTIYAEINQVGMEAKRACLLI